MCAGAYDVIMLDFHLFKSCAVKVQPNKKIFCLYFKFFSKTRELGVEGSINLKIKNSCLNKYSFNSCYTEVFIKELIVTKFIKALGQHLGTDQGLVATQSFEGRSLWEGLFPK